MFDAQTVFLHENGHEVGFGHSNVVGAVMEATYAGIRRSLHQDDIDGINFLYPATADTTAPSLSSGSVAADGTTVTVTFDEALADSAPPGRAFEVTGYRPSRSSA